MAARIISEKIMTVRVSELTAGDLREFVDGLSDSAKVTVKVDNGDQREPGTTTFRSAADIFSSIEGRY